MSEILEFLPRERGYFMPAEWARHEATWMSWAFGEELWSGSLGQAREEQAALVRAIARQERVHLLVRDEESEGSAWAMLSGVESLSIERIPLNDVWMRDNGPTFVVRSGTEGCAPALGLVDWRFNAWGQKYDWALDDQVPRIISGILGMSRFVAPLVMEGGSLEVNGEGACLTTEQCLLSPLRNPGLGKAELERALRDHLGVTQVIWLRSGLEGDHTDGHVDTFARFIAARRVLMSVSDDPSDENHGRMAENLEILRAVRFPDGGRLEVQELPLPSSRYHLADGKRLPATYANFYLANGVVLVPQYGDPQDERALGIIQEAFPGREALGLSSRRLILEGGSFHCLTQQQPDPRPFQTVQPEPTPTRGGK